MDDNSPNNSSPLDIHIDRLTQQPGESVPPEMRRNDSDRRQEDLGPPDGVEDRRKGDRRSKRLSTARERYLDMVLKAIFSSHNLLQLKYVSILACV